MSKNSRASLFLYVAVHCGNSKWRWCYFSQKESLVIVAFYYTVSVQLQNIFVLTLSTKWDFCVSPGEPSRTSAVLVFMPEIRAGICT